jgi:hypothetical protein
MGAERRVPRVSVRPQGSDYQDVAHGHVSAMQASDAAAMITAAPIVWHPGDEPGCEEAEDAPLTVCAAVDEAGRDTGEWTWIIWGTIPATQLDPPDYYEAAIGTERPLEAAKAEAEKRYLADVEAQRADDDALYQEYRESEG